MASTTSSSHRELAAQLMAAQSSGIAGFVQERVHSTSIGVEATAAFLQQLVQELEDAAAEYLVPGAEALEHAQEVELGTLVTASSLSVRYVTEREAMLPLLSRFRAVFTAVLHFESWGKAFIGLKAVALMASTRVLEAFGAQVSTEDVEQELQWLLELFVPPQENEHQWLLDLFAPQDADLSVQKADYLLRPTCEFVSVATQTHESAREMIYSKILPQLLTLVQRFGDEYSGEVRVTDAALNELVLTMASLLDAKLPPPASNVFALLPVPSFVEEIEASDAGASTAAVASKDGEENEDEDPESPLKFSNGDSSVYQCVATLCGWLGTSGRRTSASVVLPFLCHSIHLNDPEQNNTDMVATIVDSLVSSLREVQLNAVPDFEYVNALLESLRDATLRIPHFKADLVATLYTELRSVMPRLETALQASTLEREELQSVKSTCSKIRQTLVEAFLAWIYNAGAANFATHQEDFLGETSTKLADPRIFGDVIHVVRKGDASESDATSLVERCAMLLTQALKQLDRYSKTTAKHIVSAVTRAASASGKLVAPHADELALPLLVSIVDGSCKGKSLRARLEAVACVSLGSSEDEAFKPEDHPWATQFCGVLLDNAQSESAHTLSILASVISASPLLLAQVAAVCAQKSQVVGQIFHDSLSRWPLYEEDIDGVILTLEILKTLLVDSAFRALLDPVTIASTVQKLSENAKSDDLDLVASACDEALALDFFESAEVAK